MVVIWLGFVCIRFWNNFQTEGNLRQFAGNTVRLEGRISSEPILQGGSQRFRIGRVWVRVSQYPSYGYGQSVYVSGTLQRKVLNRWHSQFSLMYPDVKRVKADRVKIMGSSGKELLMRLRRQIEMVYNRNLPEPEASLLAGVVLGAKRDLPYEFWRALQRTGTLHIVVASGYNVTVVIGTMITYLAGWVKRRTAVMLGILGVIGYTIMAGAEPAIVRAAIMGSLAYFGQVLGRKADGLRLLTAAGMVMLAVKPLLIFDVGWQLSIGATAGLLLVSPLLEGVFRRVWLVGKDMTETVSAQIAVWPILLISFGSLSIGAVVVNSLILWLVPVIMGLGAILGLGGMIWPSGGQMIGWLVYGPLTMMVRVIEWFGVQEWMSWQAEGVSWWWGLGYYLVLGVLLAKFYRHGRERFR